MAKIIGTIPTDRKRGFLNALASRVSESARLRTEAAEGGGVRLLLDAVRSLPDQVTMVLTPTLGFMMKAECCVIGPGRILVINTLHFRGAVREGQKTEWIGTGGIDLGRPDRRTHLFADRLRFSGNAEGFSVEPLLVLTAGAVEFGSLKPMVPVLTLEELRAELARLFPANLVGPDPADLIRSLSS